MLANLKTDSLYIWRKIQCRNFVEVGVFADDDGAKAAVPKEEGRLAVRIGDFAFPIADFSDGSWVTPILRKSYR